MKSEISIASSKAICNILHFLIQSYYPPYQSRTILSHHQCQSEEWELSRLDRFQYFPRRSKMNFDNKILKGGKQDYGNVNKKAQFLQVYECIIWNCLHGYSLWIGDIFLFSDSIHLKTKRKRREIKIQCCRFALAVNVGLWNVVLNLSKNSWTKD